MGTGSRSVLLPAFCALAICRSWSRLCERSVVAANSKGEARADASAAGEASEAVASAEAARESRSAFCRCATLFMVLSAVVGERGEHMWEMGISHGTRPQYRTTVTDQEKSEISVLQ